MHTARRHIAGTLIEAPITVLLIGVLLTVSVRTSAKERSPEMPVNLTAAIGQTTGHVLAQYRSSADRTAMAQLENSVGAGTLRP